MGLRPVAITMVISMERLSESSAECRLKAAGEVVAVRQLFHLCDHRFTLCGYIHLQIYVVNSTLRIDDILLLLIHIIRHCLYIFV